MKVSRISNPCAVSPCQNGGICLEPFLFPNGTLTPEGYYRCDCVPPWVGTNCDQYMSSKIFKYFQVSDCTPVVQLKVLVFAACGGNLTGPIGRFSSPTEPGHESDNQYLHNANCRWEITVQPDEVVWLKVLSFSLINHLH